MARNSHPRNLPEALLQSLEGLPGFERTRFETVHADSELRAALRVNPVKWNDRDHEALLASLPSSPGSITNASAIPWWEGAYQLQPRPVFALDPLWHAGAYYVQEASSMFLGHALRELLDGREGLRVVDVCAAPGGKSTQLAALPQTGLLLSNETIRSRVPALYENLVKWGSPKAFISSEDPSVLGALGEFFDVMVVDAPCSGSGLFRKAPEAIAEWSPAHVELCSRRQMRILSEALPALAPGGILAYSTCSYSLAENEDIIDWLVREKGFVSLKICLHEDWGIVESTTKAGAIGYRFYPDRLAGEGFFLACLQKPEAMPKVFRQVKPDRSAAYKGTDISDWLEDLDGLHLTEREDGIIAIPKELAPDMAWLGERLRLRKSGLRIGRVLRGTLLPDHELAMSSMLHRDRTRMPLERKDAVRYLRKESLDVPGHPHGWVLPTWMGMPLGLLKCMPGRTNNHYPPEWRIRSSGGLEALSS